MLKTKKPTGDTACPPEIKCAHRIERKINERAEVRELSNDGMGTSWEDSDIEVLGKYQVRTAIARRAPTPPPHCNARITPGAKDDALGH